MSEHLPLLRFGRALIPGTRHAVRTQRDDLGVGARVVVVLQLPDGTIGDVGTASRVHGVGRRGDDLVLDLVGESLVTVRPRDEDAMVSPVDGDPTAATGDVVSRAQVALRTYMAARAEAGLGGDVHITLDPNPVTASHQVASDLEISWPEVQEIFEAGNAGERLEREIQVLRRETALLQAVLGRSE
ncbi:MAG TPA: hypothetical protein VK960_10635 [Acidimicrobiia bacterium]|nr:hypothetical protein [Acidimicrobiia bacterium]